MNSSPSESAASKNTALRGESFIQRGVGILRNEFPEAYFRMCSTIAGRSLALAIDGNTTWVEVRRFELLFVSPQPNVDVRIESDSATVLDVIDARLTLDGAIRSGRLTATGSRKDLSACYDALLFFVKGAVRSPSLPFLLEEFRWKARVSS